MWTAGLNKATPRLVKIKNSVYCYYCHEGVQG